MTMKSLLLGAAAGIAAVGTAQAADLPMTKGEAVEYVKVCTEFGPGFFYIPGSDTCLKIGGEIRADYRVFGGTGFSRDDNRSAFGTQGRIWFDARTQTDWGLLRSYFQINASGRTASATGLGTQNKFEVDKAFIQFGGLTAGYAHSFFGFYDNNYGNTIWAPYYAESSTVNLLAYTAQFGGGFQATLSIEDGRDHRSASQFGDIVIAGTRYNYRQGGQQFPDIVGQLRLDQSWGGLAVQAALHQNRSGENYQVDTDGDGIVDATVNNPHKSKVGWAVGATALIKIPAIEEGHFIVEGQYANGATHYLGSGNTISGTTDYYLAPVGTTGIQGKAGKGWSIVAELGGNITPVLNANLVGSYIDTKYDNSWGTGNPDFGVKEYTIAGNLTYTIVKGLTVGLEVAYTREQRDNLQVVGGTAEAPTVSFVDDKRNVWQAGVRLKRKF